jgi:hypothetical protein
VKAAPPGPRLWSVYIAHPLDLLADDLTDFPLLCRLFLCVLHMDRIFLVSDGVFDRKWEIDGAIHPSNVCYVVDLGVQQETQDCLNGALVV